jgi:hypothetical protein
MTSQLGTGKPLTFFNSVEQNYAVNYMVSVTFLRSRSDNRLIKIISIVNV